MKRISFFLFLFLFSFASQAQKQFIRANSNSYFGSAIRVIATKDLGWIIFSLDSLKLAKYSSCSNMEWSKQYFLPNQNDNVRDNDIIQTIDSGYVILTRIQNGSLYAPLVTKINKAGDIQWSKAYEDTAVNQYPYTVSEDNSGNIFIYSNAIPLSNPGNYNLICKIDSSGCVKFTKLYDQSGSWGRAITTSDNGVLARSGNRLIKTDTSGVVEWTSVVQNSSPNFLAPVEVSDGYIFAGNNSNSNYISFFKVDKQGNLLKSVNSDFPGEPPPLRKKKNGNFAGIFSSVISGSYFSTIVELDPNLNIKAQSTINYYQSGMSLAGLDMSFSDTDLVMLTGTTMPDTFMFFSRMDSLYTTGCDTNLVPMTVVPSNALQTFITTHAFSYSLQARLIVDSAVAISDSQFTLCSVPLDLSIGGDTIICGSRPSILRNVADIFEKYMWSTGQNTESIDVTDPGVYWMSASYNCGMSVVQDTINVQARPLTIPDLGDDVLKCENASIELNGPECSTCLFEWSTGNTSTNILANNFGKYWLTVDNNGCVASDTVIVKFAKCECDFFVPNTVTPNNDGVNETFVPKYYCDMEDYSMRIYNRWGELIFESTDPQQHWDCRYHDVHVEEGVYIYKIEFSALMSGVPYDRIERVGRLGVVY